MGLALSSALSNFALSNLGDGLIEQNMVENKRLCGFAADASDLLYQNNLIEHLIEHTSATPASAALCHPPYTHPLKGVYRGLLEQAGVGGLLEQGLLDGRSRGLFGLAIGAFLYENY
jgi:hypothetical protein